MLEIGHDTWVQGVGFRVQGFSRNWALFFWNRICGSTLRSPVLGHPDMELAEHLLWKW